MKPLILFKFGMREHLQQFREGLLYMNSAAYSAIHRRWQKWRVTPIGPRFARTRWANSPYTLYVRATSRQLLHDVKFDLGDPAVHHSQRIGRGIGDVDHTSVDVRTAVVDPNRHRAPGGDIGHLQLCAEWQRWMRGRQFVGIELFAARGLGPLGIETGNSLRGRLVSPAFCRGANGVCLCADTTGRRKGCGSVRYQCRLPRGRKSPEFLLTTEDWAQAASDAAASATANS